MAYGLLIRLGDLDSSIALSLESHPHLRTSIINFIVGEFPAVILTVSFVIRCSATSHIIKWHILRRQLWWNVSSLDLSSSFNAQLALPQSAILATIAW
jgi:hypothetical protein